ncbi:MAG: alpha/beta hydrolase [Desulfovibrionaceae bacterium]|nr:alpha/beta hydrolase [Desulfovibrionaceae bacterium]MBF0515050.1 alpha/beta hydrolase [Desulfovibrionaceae bacterium]
MPELLRGAVRLHYRLAGRGRALVFIHGNSCDQDFFAPQAACFAATHTVLSLDLRGHGQSDKPVWDYTVHGLAEDVAWLCGELGVARAALIGHSLGGAVAVQAACRHPGLAACVAALDSALIPGPGRPSRLTALLGGLSGPDYLKAARRYFESAFEPDDDPAVKEDILRRICLTPRHVMVSLFEHSGRFDWQTALASLEAPLLYLMAKRQRGDLGRLAELVPGLTIGQTVGSGHFMTLLVPEQVNAMLARFLEMTGWR